MPSQFTSQKNTTSRRRGAVCKTTTLEKKTRSKQLFMVLLIWIAVAGFGILGFNNAKRMFELDVHSVQINSDFKNTQRQQLAESVKPFLRDGFFTINLDPIKQELERQEWVYQAQVQRRWPSGISVDIIEQKPIAIWNATALLNADGQSFAKGSTVINRLKLPRLAGATGDESMMVMRYQEFSRMLEPLDQSIVELHHDELQGVTAILSSGIEIRFGNQDLMEKMKHFLNLHRSLLGHRIGQLASIDFRYQRGAALRWHAPIGEKVAAAELELH